MQHSPREGNDIKVDLTRGQGMGGHRWALEVATENDLEFLCLLCLLPLIYVPMFLLWC